MASHDNPSDPPTVVLAGREWPIPVLAPRQNRIVVPALLELIPKILRARDEASNAGESRIAQLARYLDTPAYDRLADVAFTALTRAAPELSRAEFDELPIGTLELIAAAPIVALQAGLLKRASASDG